MENKFINRIREFLIFILYIENKYINKNTQFISK
jgi:hypothetical protein